MTSAIIFVISAILLGMLISVLSKRRIGITLLPAIVIEGLLGVILCILDFVSFARFLPFFIGIISLAALLSSLKKNLENRKFFLNNDLIFIVFAACLFFLLNVGRVYMLNDEFSHWGLAIKNLIMVGELPYGAATNAIYKTYPPFATVVCFFGTSLSKTINESGTFIPMDMMLLASFMPVASCFFKKTEEKTSKLKSLIYLFPVFAAFVFTIIVFKLSAFTIIAVDTLLGAMAGYMIVTAVFSEEKTLLPEMIFSVLTSVALAFTKETGMAFALFAGIIVFVILIIKLLPLKKYTGISAAGFGLIILPILTGRLWNRILISNGVSPDERSISKTLLGILVNGFSETQWEITKAFFKAWVLPKISIGIPLLLVFVGMIGVSVVICVINRKTEEPKNRRTEEPKNRKTITLINILLPILFLIYEGGILSGYYARFVENEALNVASFERYSGSFLTLWMVVIMGELLALLPFINVKIIKYINITCAVVSVGLVVFFGTLYPYTAAKSQVARNSYGGDAGLYNKLVSENIPFDQEVYMDAEGRELLVLNYDACPYKVISTKQ